VDPTKIGGEFSKVIEDEVLGTNTEILVRLNHLYAFRNENEEFLSDHKSKLKKNVGNITESTEFYFEFDVRGDDEIQKL